jgi:hypothetical protein
MIFLQRKVFLQWKLFSRLPSGWPHVCSRVVLPEIVQRIRVVALDLECRRDELGQGRVERVSLEWRSRTVSRQHTQAWCLGVVVVVV